jgi:hypothetical protein
MNLFIVGFDSSGLEVESMRRALRDLANEVSFLNASPIQSWQASDANAAGAWLCQDAATRGGIEYVHVDACALGRASDQLERRP